MSSFNAAKSDMVAFGAYCSGGMEPNDEKKKINDDLVVFMRKRSETEAPRYTARLKTYVDFQQKRRRAAAARRHSDHHHDGKVNVPRKKTDGDQKEKTNEIRAIADNIGATMRRSTCGMSGERPGSEDGRVSRRREEKGLRGRSFSRSRSGEPSDRCGRRRRRRRRRRCGRRRRRRRRSRRRRRRRRSCRRRRRRRRRRSCSRRRRRRSCRRRRRRRRRRC